MSSVERGAEEKTQYMYIVRGTCHVTQTFTHADIHSRRRSLTQTSHARVTEGRGSARRGTVGTCYTWETKREMHAHFAQT